MSSGSFVYYLHYNECGLLSGLTRRRSSEVVQTSAGPFVISGCLCKTPCVVGCSQSTSICSDGCLVGLIQGARNCGSAAASFSSSEFHGPPLDSAASAGLIDHGHCMDQADLYRLYCSSGFVTKKDHITGDPAYVVQIFLSLAKGGKGPNPFLSFGSARGLLGFVGHWSRMQRLRVGTSAFTMECVRAGNVRKWVIDIDGKPEELHAIGLCASKKGCTAAEVEVVDSLALRYAGMVLRCLKDISFLGLNNDLFFTMLRRHASKGERNEKSEVLYSKLSIHLTLNVAALHEEWLKAMGEVYRVLDGVWAKVKQEERASIVPVWMKGEEEQRALRLLEVDDRSIVRNSTGQNISILFSNKMRKPGEPVEAQPLFAFAGLFHVGTKASGFAGEQWVPQYFAVDCIAYDCSRYIFSSMAVIDPLCCQGGGKGWDSWKAAKVLRVNTWNAQQEKKRKRLGVEDVGNVYGKGRVLISEAGARSNKWFDIQEILPLYAYKLLIGSSTVASFSADRLYTSSLPSCISGELKPLENIWCVQLQKMRVCPRRYLHGQHDALVPHTSNGCKVCVYMKEGGSKVRVFAFCHGCRTSRHCVGKNGKLGSGGFVLERERGDSALNWPWVEIFPEDSQ